MRSSDGKQTPRNDETATRRCRTDDVLAWRTRIWASTCVSLGLIFLSSQKKASFFRTCQSIVILVWCSRDSSKQEKMVENRSFHLC
jgi:hypothetical protein